MSRKAEILAQIENVPALPTAATVVIRQLRDPNVDIAKLTRNIEIDQSLTINILKLANSAIFGAPRKIGSIHEAITRIGLQKLFQLVVASTIGPMTRVEIKGYDLPAGSLWKHSVRVAVGVSKLAELLSIRAPDHAFTTGLVHDIGKIVLGTFVNVDIDAIVQCAYEQMISFDRAESEVLGVDHAEVGAMLLEHWNLPEDISQVVRFHHRVPSRNSDTVLDLVHVTDAYCLMSGDGFGMDGLHYRVCNEAANRLGVTNSVGEELLIEIEAASDELKDILDLVSG